ncbi:hypothetical protein BH23ACT10_BH23ACT10_12320 [soil metagenome]
MEPQIVRDGEGSHLAMGPAESLRFVVTADQVDDQVEFAIDVVGTNAGPPLHIHERHTEIVHVVEGRVYAQLGDDRVDLSPGDTLIVPPGVMHTMTNLHDTPARLVAVSTPGGVHAFLAEIAALPQPPDEQAMAEIGVRHGHRLAGPPLAAMPAGEEAR